MHIYTVSELTREIKNLIETSFPPIWIEGEVTDLRAARSQHLYFSIKDDRAILSCIMFRQDQDITTSIIKNGTMIKLYGELNLYEKGGRYSLIARKILPIGKGDLYIRFEELKKRLEREGLFDKARKRPLPQFPEKIGIISSIHGAAIRDIVKVIRRRMRWVEIVIRDTKVQGVGAKEDITEAIREMNEWGLCDMIIITRGGGSIEDLWPFNEEVVARAIYESRLPVLSAIGHEIDYTVTDFVSDARAATPSVAGEIAVRDSEELSFNLNKIERDLYNIVAVKIDNTKGRLSSIEKSYGLSRPLNIVYERRQWVDDTGRRFDIIFKNLVFDRKNRFLTLSKSLVREGRYCLETMSQRLRLMENRLSDLSPDSVLKRGYSICLKLPQQKIVSDSAHLSCDDRVRIKFSKGSTEARVVS